MPVITYNGYTISDSMFFDKFEFHIDYTKVRVACNFIISSSSEAGLVSACASAEDALRDRYKDFSLTFGGTSEYSYSHTSNTYLLPVPSLTKISGHPANTNLTRPYRLEINAELPADQSGYSFRREASFNIDFAPSRRRTANFRLLYTAGGADSSRTKYLAAGKTYAASILNGLSPSGTFELVHENIGTEQEDKLCNVSLVYQEILSPQTDGGVTDLVDIARTSLQYSVDIAQDIGESPTGGYKQNPGVVVTVNYHTFVNKENVAETEIEDVWHSDIKSWIISRAHTILGLDNYTQVGSIFITVSDRHQIDPTEFTITGTLSFTAPKSTNSTILVSENFSEDIDEGVVDQKLWDGLDDTYATYSMGRRKIITRTIMVSQLSQTPAPPRLLGGNYQLRNTRTSLKVDKIGVGTVDSDVFSFLLYTKTFTETYRLVIPKQQRSIGKQQTTTLGVLAQPGG